MARPFADTSVDPVRSDDGRGRLALRCYRDPASIKDWCGEDVYDVTTQSQELALDGTKYRDW